MKQRSSVDPAFVERIFEWAQTMGYRAIAKRLVEEGHPPIHFATVGTFLKNRNFTSQRSNAVPLQVYQVEGGGALEVVHKRGQDEAPPGWRERLDRERDESLDQLAKIQGELLFLARDDDSLFYKTGPLVIDGNKFSREFILDDEGERIRLTTYESAAMATARKTRIQALQAAQRGVGVRAGVITAYAKLELLVKSPSNNVIDLQPGEADAIATQATEDEIRLIEAGDTKALSRVLERIRGR